MKSEHPIPYAPAGGQDVALQTPRSFLPSREVPFSSSLSLVFFFSVPSVSLRFVSLIFR